MNAANQIIGKFVTLILNPAIGVIFALAGLLFVWGIVQFLKGLQEGKVNDEGKQHMLWGVVGMLIMVSVFGILSLLSNTFGLGLGARGTYNINQSSLNNVNVPSFGQ
jgi:hypothetical protein